MKTEFGCHVLEEGQSYDSIKGVIRAIENSGFSSFWIYDHFFLEEFSPQFECWTLMSALATETKKLRFGPIVLSNSYRHPAVLAKMTSCLDALSNGRLEFAIGAGWYQREYIAYGIPFPPASVRIEQLKESVQLIKKMWTEKVVTFHGKYYNIEGAVNEPKPFQKPHPPLWIGGKGEKLILKVVAEEADVYNAYGIDPQGLRHKCEIIDYYCKSVGREPKDIRRTIALTSLVSQNNVETSALIEKFKPKYLSVREFVNNSVIGTPDQCIEKIAKYVESGATYFIIDFPDMKDFRSLKIFEREILPSFR